MLKNSRLAWVGCLLLAVVLVAGVYHLFQLRFAIGDNYPPYSSLRSDPMGTKVLHDSFADIPGVKAERWFEQVPGVPPGTGRTLFLIGIPAGALKWMSENDAADVDRFLHDGGRLVITLLPEYSSGWVDRVKASRDAQTRAEKEDEKDSKESKDKGSKKDKPKRKRTDSDSDDEPPSHVVDFTKRAGLGFEAHELARIDGLWEAVPVLRGSGAPTDLPAQLAWHSALVLTNSSPAWTPIYLRGANAVAAERRMGKGTVVVFTDSFPVSNEALLRHREPALLSWLMGPNRLACFDETHLGVAVEDGVATLILRYRLEGVVLSFLLLGGLFIWRNATSLVPPYEEPTGNSGNVVVGRDSGSGFVNLLRRGVPLARLPATCVAEWKKSWGAGRPDREKKIAEVEQLLINHDAAETAAPVAWYREVCQRLRR